MVSYNSVAKVDVTSASASKIGELSQWQQWQARSGDLSSQNIPSWSKAKTYNNVLTGKFSRTFKTVNVFPDGDDFQTHALGLRLIDNNNKSIEVSPWIKMKFVHPPTSQRLRLNKAAQGLTFNGFTYRNTGPDGTGEFQVAHVRNLTSKTINLFFYLTEPVQTAVVEFTLTIPPNKVANIPGNTVSSSGVWEVESADNLGASATIQLFGSLP